MPSILCLSGWGQEYKSLEDSLQPEIKNQFSTSSLNYSQYNSFFAVKEECSVINNPDIILGWSLGGQLAIRLIEAQIFKPKLLILIAPPFQLVKDSRIKAGMAPNIYQEFYNNFSLAPDTTLKKFAILSLMNDKNRAEILKNIKIDDGNSKNLIFWLEELNNFSCFNIDFVNMPSTLLLVGRGDMVVHPMQAQYFVERIKDLTIHYFDNCGHAPHLSDNQLFNKIIFAKISSLGLS